VLYLFCWRCADLSKSAGTIRPSGSWRERQARADLTSDCATVRPCGLLDCSADCGAIFLRGCRLADSNADKIL
jgi:hypothetical protein